MLVIYRQFSVMSHIKKINIVVSLFTTSIDLELPVAIDPFVNLLDTCNRWILESN